MKQASILLTENAEGLWQAQGHVLGQDIVVTARTLWDCLKECKQLAWDAEIARDAAAGLLGAGTRRS